MNIAQECFKKYLKALEKPITKNILTKISDEKWYEVKQIFIKNKLK